MTLPRRHIPGQVAMVSRRCAQRCYFLRPDDFIEKVVTYETAKAADKYGQQVYAAVAMSNHVHFGVGDTTAERSKFMQETMSGIARARNCDLERTGHFWGAGAYGDTVLLDKASLEAKLMYIWMNPVRAGLVESVDDWPGFMILPKHWGKTISVAKPGKYYGDKSPESVEFTPQPPPGYEGMSLDKVKALFEKRIRKAEAEIAALRRGEGFSFLGAAAICAVNPFDSPKTEASFRTINPRFASRNAALMTTATLSYRAFCDSYQRSRKRWLKGGENVQFPCGTLQLKREAPVTCRPPRDDEPGLFATV